MASTNGETKAPKYSPATLAVHGDDSLNQNTDVAPAMHVSTTFRYSRDPEELDASAEKELKDISELPHIYSRLAAPNTTRLEAILSELLTSPSEPSRPAYAITYASGLSAFHALLTYYAPKRIAIYEGYHGCHGVISIHTKLSGLQKIDLRGSDEEWDAAGLGKGDIVHVESPLNPTGEAINIRALAERAHKRGSILSVDATFAPPPLQDPWAQGVDVVMHSGTKYFGGHSDMLCGVLATREKSVFEGLWKERVYLGNCMGSFEGWLGVRSLRTLELRVRRQSESATALVRWIQDALDGKEQGEEAELVKGLVTRVQHASLQKEDWVKQQMPNGFGPVFALWMKEPRHAKHLPSKLALFHHATSLGGVESLIEWRKMSDDGVDERLLRVSVGVEDCGDLKRDLLDGFKALSQERV